MIFRQDEAPNVKRNEKKASTLIALNDVLTLDANGFLDVAVTASTNIAGISGVVVRATDSDYASTTRIPYDQPKAGNQFLADCDTIPTQSMKGEFFDLLNGQTVKNSVAGTVRHVKVKDIIIGTTVATSKLVVEFNPAVVFNA